MDSLRQLLSEKVKVTQVVTATTGAAGATDIEATTIDMQGFASLAYIVVMGAIVAGAVTSIEARQGDASNGSDATALEGTKQTIADDDDNQIFVIDIASPSDRYQTLHVDRATQNATVQTALAVQYNPRDLPTSFAVTDLVNLEQFGAPVEGTA